MPHVKPKEYQSYEGQTLSDALTWRNKKQQLNFIEHWLNSDVYANMIMMLYMVQLIVISQFYRLKQEIYRL